MRVQGETRKHDVHIHIHRRNLASNGDYAWTGEMHNGMNGRQCRRGTVLHLSKRITMEVDNSCIPIPTDINMYVVSTCIQEPTKGYNKPVTCVNGDRNRSSHDGPCYHTYLLCSGVQTNIVCKHVYMYVRMKGWAGSQQTTGNASQWLKRVSTSVHIVNDAIKHLA